MCGESIEFLFIRFMHAFDPIKHKHFFEYGFEWQIKTDNVASNDVILQFSALLSDKCSSFKNVGASELSSC